MRISKELEDKIKRNVNAKYEKEVKTLNDEKNKIIDDEVKKATAEVKEATTTYAAVDNYIKYQFGSYTRTIQDLVSQNHHRFIGDKSYKHIDRKLGEINAKKARDIENMMIAISYEKDIDGIKKAFSDNGFEF